MRRIEILIHPRILGHRGGNTLLNSLRILGSSPGAIRRQMMRVMSILIVAGLCAAGALADSPVPTPNHPTTATGVTSYVNQNGTVVATSSWTVTTSGPATGQVSIQVTVQNLTSSCPLTGAGFGMWFATPGQGGVESLATWGLSANVTVQPGQSFSYSGSNQTVILPTQIDGAGLMAFDFWGPDPTGTEAQKGSLPYSFALLNKGSCFATSAGGSSGSGPGPGQQQSAPAHNTPFYTATLFASGQGAQSLTGLVVDNLGNIDFLAASNGSVQIFQGAHPRTGPLGSLVSIGGVGLTAASNKWMAADGLGGLYIADEGTDTVYKLGSQLNLITVVPSKNPFDGTPIAPGGLADRKSVV